jgi:L-rhamnose isomerase
MPFGAVWEYYCLKADVPSAGSAVIRQVLDYEAKVQSKRG